MIYKNPTEKSAQASIRFSVKVHRNLMDEAMQKGTTLSDVVRERIWLSDQQISLADQLAQLEKRILSRVFDICAAVANLNDAEKEKAARIINK